MKYGRMVCTRLGGPEVLAYVEEELREPGAGEVRVRVLAAGVSWADCMMRRGTYPGQPKPPFTPGYDVVGVVDKVGEGVGGLKEGRRVAALMVRGGYAEYVYAPEGEWVEAPEGVDAASEVALVLNYVTAYQMLHGIVLRGGETAQAGERMLVHSAAGGVGTAVLELARIAGVKTIGTASKGKHEVLRRLGCEAVDYRARRFEEAVKEWAAEGVEAALDPVGGWHWVRSRRCVKRGGAVVAYGSQGAGMAADVACAVILMMGRGKKFVFYSITKEKERRPEKFRADLGALFGMLERGGIRPVIAGVLPWRRAAEANAMLERGAVEGKLVLGF